MDDTTGRVDTDAQDDTDLRTQEIREEIAQTRVEMSETIEAIQERLSPSHLVAQAGETVRNATTEKVKQMANTAGHAADQVMDSSIGKMVKDNPIPAAMIGIGAAWLLMKGRSSADKTHRDYSRYRVGGSYDTAAYGNESYGAGSRDWRATTAPETAVGTTGFSEYGSGVTGEAARAQEFGGEMRDYDRDYSQYRSRSQSVNF